MTNETQVSPGAATCSFLSLFVVALLGALFPVLLARRLRSHKFFLLSDAFAAGILTAAAFVHLLPSAFSTLPDSNFPWAGLFALLGAASIYLLDGLSDFGRLERAGTRTALVLAAALSLHALIEGLALGASVMRRKAFGVILIAVLLHKAFAALSLGAALLGSGVSSTTCVHIAIAFAAVTPLGALGGLTLVRRALSAGTAKLTSAALTAASAGVFAYVAFAELLQHRPRKAIHTDEDVENGRSMYGACSTCNNISNGAGKELPLLSTSFQSEEVTVRSWEPLARCAVFLSAATAMSVLAIWT